MFEDDKRDWSKAQKSLLMKSMTPQLQKLLKDAGTEIDWDAVGAVIKAPRGLAVPVSISAGTVDQVLQAAPLVQNRIPEGPTGMVPTKWMRTRRATSSCSRNANLRPSPPAMLRSSNPAAEPAYDSRSRRAPTPTHRRRSSDCPPR